MMRFRDSSGNITADDNKSKILNKIVASKNMNIKIDAIDS
jgi:hypothetical protein